MIEALKEMSKEFSGSLQHKKGALITIHQTAWQHADFLTVSFILDRLANGHHVTFLAVRQNFAHYLALSKKMGKSIEPFLKSGQMTYLQSFANEMCSELPLVDCSPAVFVRPPTTVEVIGRSAIPEVLAHRSLNPETVLIVDAICFLEQDPELCYFIYENGVRNGREVILSGCFESSPVSNILANQADLSIQLQDDVGGSGKFRLKGQGKEKGVLWRWVQGKFQLSNYMQI